MQKYQTFIGNITDVIANYIPGTLKYISVPEDILSFTAAKEFRYGMRAQSEVQDNYIIYKMQCAYSCEKHSYGSNAYYISESDAKEQIDSFFTNLTTDYNQYKYELRSFKAETNDNYSYALAYFDVYEPAEVITLSNNLEISANGTYIIGDKVLNVEVPPTIEYQTIEGSSSSVPTDLNIEIEGNREYTVTANGTYSIHPSENYDVMTSVTLDVNVPTEVNLQSLGTISITSNGTTQYTPGENYDGFDAFTINTNIPIKSETSLSATGNGTYTPDDGTVYNKVTVSVPSDAKTEESLTITANGTYTPDDGKVYNKVTANIPSDKKTELTLTATANGNYTPIEGTVYNSVSVSVPSDAKTEVSLLATENKTYTPTTGSVYSSVEVNVPGKTEESLTITANGTYTPEIGSVYSSVTANVPGKIEESLTITANGTYTPETGKVYSSVTANVPGTGDMYGFDNIGYTGSETISEDVAYSLTLYNQWNSSRTSASSLYEYYTGLVYAPFIDTSNVTTMQAMFRYCTSLTCVPPLNMTLVKNTGAMFNGCTNLYRMPKLDITQLDTNEDVLRVSELSEMFYDCEKLSNLNNNFPTTIIITDNMSTVNTTDDGNPLYNFNSTFQGCKNLSSSFTFNNSSHNLDEPYVQFDHTFYNSGIKSLTIYLGNNSYVFISTMDYIAANCSSLASVELYRNRITGSVISGFENDSSLTTVTMSGNMFGYNVAQYNNCSLYGLFNGCSKLATITKGTYTDINNMQKVNNCTYMFNGCSKLRTIDAGILFGIGEGFASAQTLDFSVCPLSEASIENITYDIGTVSTAGAGSIIKFKADQYELYVTAARKATMEGKGWTVVSA